MFRQEVPLQPLPLPDGIFERVHLDTAGPYPRSRSGNRYLYLAVCANSKYPVAIAAPKLSAADFTSFFMMHVVAQHGVPAVCVHDSGPEFGEPWSTCLRELGIEQRRSSAYHPNTNGQAESMVKNILHSLQRMINEDDSPETWDERLPLALLGLRTAPNASTRHSPAYVLYGRHLCLPAQRRRLASVIQSNPGQQQRRQRQQPGQQSTQLDQQLQWTEDEEDAIPRQDPTTGAAEDLLPTTTKTTSQRGPGGQQDLLIPVRPKLESPTGQTQSLPRSPPIVLSSDSPDQDSLDEGTKALMRQRKSQLPALQQQLQKNVRASQIKMKKDHSKRRHSTRPSVVMPPGSLVLMKCPPSSKLSSGVEGPYKLVYYNNAGDAPTSSSAAAAAATTESRALLEDNTGKRWWVSITRISPFKVSQ